MPINPSDGALNDWADAMNRIDALETRLSASRSRETKLREALTQITKRDDWTSGECRHHARAALREE